MTTSTAKTKTQHMLYFLNPDDLLIPYMMIDTSPWSSCSRCQPGYPVTISSTGASVSPFRDFSSSNFARFLQKQHSGTWQDLLQQSFWEAPTAPEPVQYVRPDEQCPGKSTWLDMTVTSQGISNTSPQSRATLWQTQWSPTVPTATSLRHLGQLSPSKPFQLVNIILTFPQLGH